MASIFTFDPDPPRVASPWSTPRSLTPGDPLGLAVPGAPSDAPSTATGGLEPRAVLWTDSSVTKLEAEPQEGPTEYKLHLLLRPRRSFTSASTAHHVPGSHRSSLGIPTPRSASESVLSRTPPKATSSQSRQHRLEQLTTQLLWRLQQSSPYHSTSVNELVIPQLPEAAPLLTAPPSLARVLPGLEESRGALYEIGVADDGTFVGLAEDEMEESLMNLRAMAASLGCTVNVLRMIPVGDCTWSDEIEEEIRTGRLWVAEAFVKPDVTGSPASESAAQLARSLAQMDLDASRSASEQLRVSLTGATMSGKSSLLGSLSTATLDNGRGKSRLSLLKHRHEIASGMTSSVTQELIGYHEASDGSGDVDVINYASGNVDSWDDIHSACESGRLVFLSDSAGHPRYRRTTVRGLMGWAPHWTLLCMPADNDEDTSGKVGSTPSSQEVLGAAAADVDLSEAHLELCLKLELPLIVVVTKLDLASKTGLRQTLSKLLSMLKTAGRKPSILPDTGVLVTEDDLELVPASDLKAARQVVDELAHDPLGVVPIVLTSAVKGAGIRKLHALLHEIQIPAPAVPPQSQDTTLISSKNSKPSPPLSALYHIEDIYSINSGSNAAQDNTDISIISGHLRYGALHLGDELLLGPYPIGTLATEDSDSSGSPAMSGPSATIVATSRSFPGALHKGLTLPYHHATSATRSSKHPEWRKVRITSIRNLRLPVRTLHAGQVGTLGIVPVDDDDDDASPLNPRPTPAPGRIRKGMVLARGSPQPQSHRAFVARFVDEGVRGLIVGSLAVVYMASVRASAKVIAIAIDEGKEESKGKNGIGVGIGTSARKHSAKEDDDGFGFDFEDDSGGDADGGEAGGESTLVTFQFVATREFIEAGARVLVMEGGRPRSNRVEKNVVGLEGFVGGVVEGFGFG